MNSNVKCTKPPEIPAPSYCGKAPDGVDCYICKFAKVGKEKRVIDYARRGSDKAKGA